MNGNGDAELDEWDQKFARVATMNQRLALPLDDDLFELVPAINVEDVTLEQLLLIQIARELKYGHHTNDRRAVEFTRSGADSGQHAADGEQPEDNGASAAQ